MISLRFGARTLQAVVATTSQTTTRLAAAPQTHMARSSTMQVRHFGIMDTVKKGFEEGKANKEEKEYIKQVEQMASKPEFGMHDFKAQLEEGFSSWRAKVC
jgi:hypothetical protein